MCLATRSSVNRLACVLIVRLVRLLPAHASTQRRTRCSIVMVSYVRGDAKVPALGGDDPKKREGRATGETLLKCEQWR